MNTKDSVNHQSVSDQNPKETNDRNQNEANGKDPKESGSRKRKTGYVMLALALLCLLLIVVFFNQKNTEKAEDAEKAEKAENQVLTVGLYSYVPDLKRFEKAITENWEAEHPGTKLQFVDWSCYDNPPPDDLDVFVFDCIYLTEFMEQGCLLPIPEEAIQDKEDIFSFSMDGCTEEGKFCAVPQTLCTFLLYTRKTDTELADVSDILTLYEKIGDRQLQTEIPEQNEGLLIDLSGGTTKATMYLDAKIDQSNTYTEYDDLPDEETLSEDSLEMLRLLRKMGGDAQVQYWSEDNDAYVRAKWLSQGKGRAMIAYSEVMSDMPDYVDQVDFRTFSYSDKGGISLYYANLTSINAKIADDKKELAYDLVNVLTGTDTIVKACSPAEEDGAPQYLLPARASAYDRLGEKYPAYTRLKEIVSNPDNRLFRLGKNARVYIKNTKKVLPGLVFTGE